MYIFINVSRSKIIATWFDFFKNDKTTAQIPIFLRSAIETWFCRWVSILGFWFTENFIFVFGFFLFWGFNFIFIFRVLFFFIDCFIYMNVHSRFAGTNIVCSIVLQVWHLTQYYSCTWSAIQINRSLYLRLCLHVPGTIVYVPYLVVYLFVLIVCVCIYQVQLFK